MSKVDKALSCFNEGFNCSQAILSTYCEELGLEKETALKLSSGLGGGMGRLQEVCGAVTGAFLVIGLKHGNASYSDIDSKESVCRLIQKFNNRFKERNQTINCKELLRVNLITGDKAVNSQIVKKICPKMVKDSAEILEEILYEKR